MLHHQGSHSWERRPDRPLCRVCHCAPCLCFPGITALTPILERIALELEIKNRKDELARLREPWWSAENLELRNRLRAELAQVIAKRRA